MASAKFYMVYVDRNEDTAYEELENKMNLAVDWYRINSQLWILYTTSDEEKWYSRLESLVKPGGHVFICKLDKSKRQGWMKKDFWKWIRREKN